MGKVWVDGVTGQQREIDGRHEFDLKINLKASGCKKRLLSCFWLNFQAAIEFAIASVRLVMPKIEIDGFTEPRRESDLS